MRTFRRYAARLFLAIPVDPPLRARRGLLLAWYVTVVCLAVIASTTGVRAADFTNVDTKTLQAIEVEAGRALEQHPQLLAALGGDYGDPALTAYVTAVAERLLAPSSFQRLGYRFRFVVTDSPDVFALSMAGGNIYLSRGMLALANNEAELAAVLSHEIAHVVLRHGAERAQLARSMRGRANQAVAEQAMVARHELAADDFSLYLMAEAGYDPRAQGRFLAAVARLTDIHAEIGVAGRGELSAGHVNVDARLAQVTATAEHFTPKQGAWFAGTEAFLGAVEGMVYGRRPADGMVDGTVYVDATNGFTFSLPPGFRFTEVGGTAINASGPSGASLRVDVAAGVAQDMVAYLRESVAETLPSLKPQAMTINGLPAAKATFTVDTAGGPASVEFVVVKLSAYSLARYQAVIPHSLSKHFIDAVRDVPTSLRPLDQDWAPLRVRVMKAEMDQPAVAFAAQMRSMDRPLDWFLAINQLTVDTTIRAGSKVKLIAP